jgi:LysR family transcriptional regulator, nod-box dependent transcriptional activator
MDLRQFDLNLLVALDALLAERSVTKAGERLHLSQPAMSGILSRLRHSFGDELLVRVGRNLEPTAFAGDLAAPLHECVQEIRVLLNSKRSFVPKTEQMSFRIGASDYVALVMGGLIQRLLELAPGITIRFVALAPTTVDKVAAGELDFAIVPFEPEHELPSISLFEDCWTCAVWSKHPTVQHSMTLDEFLALPHLSFSFYGEHLTLADDYLHELGYHSKIVASTETFSTTPFLLRGTTLATIVPKRLGERLQGAADIKLISLPFNAPPFLERLVWNPRFTASPAHAWMRAQIAEVAKTL